MTTAPVNPIESGSDGSVSMADFMELMHSFNEVTQQLEHTHDALREQVASLQGELAEANDRLRRSRSLAALGEMAAGIAHEIRNPLGSIALNVVRPNHPRDGNLWFVSGASRGLAIGFADWHPISSWIS